MAASCLFIACSLISFRWDSSSISNCLLRIRASFSTFGGGSLSTNRASTGVVGSVSENHPTSPTKWVGFTNRGWAEYISNFWVGKCTAQSFLWRKNKIQFAVATNYSCFESVLGLSLYALQLGWAVPGAIVSIVSRG